MRRSRNVAGAVASVGAAAVGFAVFTAPTAVADRAGSDAENRFLNVLAQNGATVNDGNVKQALLLGYTLCKIDQVDSSQLNGNDPVVQSARENLCFWVGVKPLDPLADGSSSSNVDVGKQITTDLGSRNAERWFIEENTQPPGDIDNDQVGNADDRNPNNPNYN